MRRRTLEERDLRSLDRAGLRSVFRPLDPSDPPGRTGPRNYRTLQMFTSAFAGEEPRWKDGIGLLFLPLLVVLITIVSWAGVPQLVGWLAVLAFVVLFSGAALFIYRRA